MPLRLLFIGDIVGEPGLRLVQRAVPWLRVEHRLDVVIANGENACGGAGLSPSQYRQLRKAGVDAITLGDHAFRKAEIVTVLEDAAEPIVRPANFPPAAPGKGYCLVSLPAGGILAVVCVMGRLYMRAADCPYTAMDRVLGQLTAHTQVVFVDFHAEATGEKEMLGRFLDGRVSAVLGTHTHVATADERILPGGTAFQCDVGMTGPHDGVLGRRIDRVLYTSRTGLPSSFDVAAGDVRISGTVVEIDPASGRALSIQRLQVREDSVPTAN